MYDPATAPIDREYGISLRPGGYEAWCSCVRRLLDWADGEMADWPQLFASGHTPRDVARAIVYGDSIGD